MANIVTPALTPGDSYNFELQNLDASYLNCLVIVLIRKAINLLNALPPFSNGLRCFTITEIPESGSFVKQFNLNQTSGFLPNTAYNGEIQIIKTTGEAESLFFAKTTTSNYIKTTPQGAVDQENIYRYIGRYSDLPGVSDKNTILFNTTDQLFYIYRDGWHNVATYTTESVANNIIDGGDSSSTYTITLDGGNA